jgi:hypothetical protein
VNFGEIAQWVVLLLLVFLLLGLYRQMSLLLPTPARNSSGGGPIVGDRLSKKALARLDEVAPDGRRPRLIAFVAQSCEGCQRLIVEARSRPPDADPVMLIARRPSAGFRDAIGEAGLQLLEDDGQLWGACSVTNTPLVIALDDDGKVLAKGVTHLVDSIAASV